MNGVLVFDDAPEIATTVDQSGQPSILLDERQDVFVFDIDAEPRGLAGDDESDFLVFDTTATVAEQVLAPADFLLVDAPREPAQVVLPDGRTEVLVISPGGPAGVTGPQGPQGLQGLPGLAGPGAYYQEFGFATPATVWTVVHNLDSFALVVEAIDQQGDPMEGYVRFPNSNTVEIDWFYPTAGAARIFR